MYRYNAATLPENEYTAEEGGDTAGPVLADLPGLIAGAHKAGGCTSRIQLDPQLESAWLQPLKSL